MLIMKRDSEDNEYQSPEMKGSDFPIHSLHLAEEPEVPGGTLSALILGIVVSVYLCCWTKFTL